jgi:hypothetical protein
VKLDEEIGLDEDERNSKKKVSMTSLGATVPAQLIVEKILGKKDADDKSQPGADRDDGRIPPAQKRTTVLYYVKWKGWSHLHCTWEDLARLELVDLQVGVALWIPLLVIHLY